MEELHRKDPDEPDYSDSVVNHPEPDLLESEIKCTLENTDINKASGCDEIPEKLFKSIHDDAIKVLHSLCKQIWKTQQ